MAVAGFSLFLLGIIFIIVAPINKRKNQRCSAQTDGILIKRIEREDSDGSLPDMYVYSYYVDGIEYQHKSTVINKQVIKIGDHCTIWYNPKKPKQAQAFHYDSNKVYKIILLIGNEPAPGQLPRRIFDIYSLFGYNRKRTLSSGGIL